MNMNMNMYMNILRIYIIQTRKTNRQNNQCRGSMKWKEILAREGICRTRKAKIKECIRKKKSMNE